MKKIILSAFLVFACVFGAFSQKVKKEYLSVSYLQLPSQPLPAYVQKYNMKPSLTYNYAVSTASLRASIEGIQLTGYQRAMDGTGEIDIQVIVEPYKNSYTQSTKAKTKKQGDATVSYTEYTVTMTHQYPIRVIVTDRTNGNRLTDFYINNNFVKAGSASSTQSYYDAKSRMNISGKRMALYNNNIASTESALNSRFGFPIRSMKVNVNYVKPKKYDYPENEQGLALAKEAFGSYAPTAEVDPNFKSKMEEAIKLWNEVVAEYDPEAKKKVRINKKVATQTLENIYMAYYFLNDWDNCVKVLEKAKTIDKRPSWAIGWANLYKAKKNRYQANGK